MAIVVTDKLTKIYGEGPTAVRALEDVDLAVEEGEFLAVMGPSGCGKSTLLHLIGGLDVPTSGSVTVQGNDLTHLSDNALTQLRRRHMGFVFQFFNLIPVLSAAENVALPLTLDGLRPHRSRRRAQEWLERVDLGERIDDRPDQLSGGQQQRVAIARALVADPALLLADEPTGNLDSKSSDEIAQLLRKVSTEYGRAIIMVTHDPRISAYADRIVFLRDGRVVDDARLAGHGTDEARDAMERVGLL
ncbi:MAG: ABC transporter ATP-binding protein [Actinobacteria bacterium]|nr:MAG: ABC transporter ATP-binding protein [Actinomycetota bacterium]